MRKYRVLVFGYLGYATNQLDGQTIKTRNIFELLRLNKNKYNYFLEYFDTQTLSKSKLSIFSMLIRLLRADKIFYLGAHKNLTFIFPFIYILSFIMRKEIYFIVVGGWLVEFLQNKPVHRFMLKRIVAIYPQTSLMVSQLCNEYGFSNVCQLHNFRIRNYNNLVYAPRRSKKIELVFMARVNPMKGLELFLN